ncbi:hypothetical protein E2C01_033746 [Portunus trituberculatus]|uniref:Uncharacterized protein n=1 Tax=Portunus trituberculatus TaxID=210409 RepID=A0A5B7EYP9_PORTR|nr:hypothetical protein [Portunus trituberculatus]
MLNKLRFTLLHLLYENKVLPGCAAPGIRQGGADLCLIENLKAPVDEEPRYPPQRCQLPRGFSGESLDV